MIRSITIKSILSSNGKELHALITEAHALNIRILLDGVFNHCGFYFPYFQDVVEKGQASQYSRWFFVQSYPIKTDPCTYDCVGHYKWMPKLNLANEAVQNYFTEVDYIGYENLELMDGD